EVRPREKSRRLKGLVVIRSPLLWLIDAPAASHRPRRQFHARTDSIKRRILSYSLSSRYLSCPHQLRANRTRRAAVAESVLDVEPRGNFGLERLKLIRREFTGNGEL